MLIWSHGHRFHQLESSEPPASSTTCKASVRKCNACSLEEPCESSGKKCSKVVGTQVQLDIKLVAANRGSRGTCLGQFGSFVDLGPFRKTLDAVVRYLYL